MASRSSAFDQQALVNMMAETGAKQADQVRAAVYDATLRAMQGRELTLQNIRGVLKTMSNTASMGAAKSGLPSADVEAMLEGAVQGMDDAMLRAVEAYRVGASKMIDQGVGMQDQVLQKAMDTVEKMEDALLKAVNQAAAQAKGAQSQLGKPWEAVLEKMQVSGTGTGAQATQAVEQIAQQMQQTMKESRAAGMRAASVFAQSWGALVSGVLIGMSDAVKQGAGKGAAKPAKK